MLLMTATNDTSLCCVLVERQALADLAEETCLFFFDSGRNRGVQLHVSADKEVYQAPDRLATYSQITPPELHPEPIQSLVVTLSRQYYVEQQMGSLFVIVPLPVNDTHIRLFGVHILQSAPKSAKETGEIIDLSLKLLAEDKKRRKRKAQAGLN
jgi:hypothetical protein